ncbi:uncharacterized protein PV09_00785 [Verruconis gallopava]|uniref:Solute carrier family 40 member n=1 Tax=Verruconis gallopava TaxID=253628 RepID=A0A0D1Y1B3_9PEZI|nr:uncharacterized protein PV09_00785 [Verruconis gallopava]KIW08861.1 hypothetical protein PV09_00785 [Verruconis gallopava]
MADESQSISRRLCISHFLSAWNSRTFEFGAVLFLATVYPGTLFYASIYALVRSAFATLFSSRLGAYVDKENRLISIRHSIVWQRVSVIASCALIFVLLILDGKGVLSWLCFGLTIALACVEKLASIGNTVAVERDWVVVVCDNTSIDRGVLNATLRRIDLFCKLVAPVFISFIDAYGTKYAVGVVLGLSGCSIGIEYLAIAQVYHAVPALSTRCRGPPVESTIVDDLNEVGIEASQVEIGGSQSPISNAIRPWIVYASSPVFLASASLSLLYLTVLSTNLHWQTYMLAISYKPLTVSFFRVLAVASELAATWVAPLLMNHIGPIRSGLWSINWQVLSLAPAIVVFSQLRDSQAHVGGATLTAGIIASRLGLWSFDLSVQYLVQDRSPSEARAAFSSCEVALQNLFELLSFLATIVFPDPRQFIYPVLISYGAVSMAAVCFAAFVRKERGHLLHASRCMGGDKKRGKYTPIHLVEPSELEEQAERRVQSELTHADTFSTN